jgi:hypothetical protein
LVTFPVLIISMAVEEVAALAELVEVVLVEALEGDDEIECARLAELDNGLLLVLVLEVFTWRILRPAFDHVAGAQLLDARTEEMGARRMARERSLSDGVIVQRTFIASATSERERERERENVGECRGRRSWP